MMNAQSPMLSELSIQNSFNLALKVGRKYTLAHCLTYLVKRPEASAVEFGCRADLALIRSAVYVHEFAVALRLEDIAQQEFGSKLPDAQFFVHLTQECIGNALPVVDMSAYRRIPFARLDILPQRALLQVESSLGIKHMQVHYRVQQLAAIVTLPARSASYHTSLLINER